MIVVTGGATERRGLLVQFHEEDLRELKEALDALEQGIHLDNAHDLNRGAPISKRFPEWARRLEAAIVAKLNDNRRFP